MKNLFVSGLVFLTSLAIGQAIRSFELLNVADGKMTSVKACSGCQGVVVIFTSLKCPYDQHYQERIKALRDKYGDKVSFFLINSSQGPDEDEPKMKEAYYRWGMNIPYLSDKNQAALKTLNATRTPEAILLKPESAGLKIVYQGAIDDNPQVHTDTGKNFWMMPFVSWFQEKSFHLLLRG